MSDKAALIPPPPPDPAKAALIRKHAMVIQKTSMLAKIHNDMKPINILCDNLGSATLWLLGLKAPQKTGSHGCAGQDCKRRISASKVFCLSCYADFINRYNEDHAPESAQTKE